MCSVPLFHHAGFIRFLMVLFHHISAGHAPHRNYFSSPLISLYRWWHCFTFCSTHFVALCLKDIHPWPVPFTLYRTLQSLTLKILKIKSKYLIPFLFLRPSPPPPWGRFASFLSECQTTAWVSKQTSSNRSDVSEKCHPLGMSCQLLCWANDHCWLMWGLRVFNSGHFVFFPFYFVRISGLWMCSRMLEVSITYSKFWQNFLGYNYWVWPIVN